METSIRNEKSEKLRIIRIYANFLHVRVFLSVSPTKMPRSFPSCFSILDERIALNIFIMIFALLRVRRVLYRQRVERTLASTVHLDYVWHCFARRYFYWLWKQRNTFLLLSIASRTTFIRVLRVRARVTQSIFFISQFLTSSEETVPVLALLSSTIDELAVYLSLEPMSRLGFVLARNFVD